MKLDNHEFSCDHLFYVLHRSCWVNGASVGGVRSFLGVNIYL